MRLTVLVVEDQEIDASKITEALQAEYFEVQTAANLGDALERLKKWPNLVILDGAFPERHDSRPTFMADRFLAELEERQDQRALRRPAVIFVTGDEQTYAHSQQVAEWFGGGRIQDVVLKAAANKGWPFFQTIIRCKAEKLREEWKLAQVTAEAENALNSLQQFALTSSQPEHPADKIIGQHPKMLEVWSTIRRVANSDADVLLLGETGTGKDLFAKAIHSLSRRHKGPFVEINLPNTRPETFASELFGHEKGAFTDAKARKLGQLELARGGTIFLNEIGELPGEIQVKLLGFLQSKVITRLGGNSEIRVDARVVAATNRDLSRLVPEGHFREDLYQRLCTVVIELPPLRSRGRDVELLAHYFLDRINEKYKKKVSFSSDVFPALEKYSWPGNVRELEKLVERNVIVNDGSVMLEQLALEPRQTEGIRTAAAHEGEAPQGILLPQCPDFGDRELLLRLQAPQREAWNSLTSEQEAAVLCALRERFLTPEGCKRLQTLQLWLVDRGPRHQSPLALHHYKALLFLTLYSDHVGLMAHFDKVLNLGSWEQKKKVLANLEAHGPFVKSEPGAPKGATKYPLLPGLLREPDAKFGTASALLESGRI